MCSLPTEVSPHGRTLPSPVHSCRNYFLHECFFLFHSTATIPRSRKNAENGWDKIFPDRWNSWQRTRRRILRKKPSKHLKKVRVPVAVGLWLIDWLIDRSLDWFIECLIDWLIDWSHGMFPLRIWQILFFRWRRRWDRGREEEKANTRRQGQGKVTADGGEEKARRHQAVHRVQREKEIRHRGHRSRIPRCDTLFMIFFLCIIIQSLVVFAGIDLKVAAKFFGQKFACGSSLTGDDEIVIQGDVKDDLLDLIPEKWPDVSRFFIQGVSGAGRIGFLGFLNSPVTVFVFAGGWGPDWRSRGTKTMIFYSHFFTILISRKDAQKMAIYWYQSYEEKNLIRTSYTLRKMLDIRKRRVCLIDRTWVWHMSELEKGNAQTCQRHFNPGKIGCKIGIRKGINAQTREIASQRGGQLGKLLLQLANVLHDGKWTRFDDAVLELVQILKTKPNNL